LEGSCCSLILLFFSSFLYFNLLCGRETSAWVDQIKAQLI
jgi:hypothetical protein